jgi:S-adenosylmethionine:tRNA ribosyltransferase-isomerase
MAEFDYPLAESAVAQTPVEPRDRARLLVVEGDAVRHLTVADVPTLVRPGDLVVVNDTQVLPARLPLRRRTGGAAEVLLLEPRADGTWEALVRPSRRVRPGATLRAEQGDLAVTVGADLGSGRRLVEVVADGAPVADAATAAVALDRYGVVPLPPYITAPLERPDRYQTVFATTPGSVAAPTAGLHLTPAVLDAVAAAGAEIAAVDLVVGLDTFRPVTADDPADHVMHSEAYRIPPDVWQAVRARRAGGVQGRVVAIGTTVVRALESAARDGRLEGRTDLFIRRPWTFGAVDCLMTNFHLPRSTLLCLVDAFVGPRWRELYDVALAAGYRFLSFGDAMWLDRAGDVPAPTRRTQEVRTN